MWNEYLCVINDVILAMSITWLICLTLDGVTNMQGKKMINLMACSLIATFYNEVMYKECYKYVEECKLRLL